MDAIRVVELLSAHLSVNGFDICAPFDANVYNALVMKQHRIPTFDMPSPLAVVIGSSAAIWEKFIAYARQHPEMAKLKDPLDAYTEKMVNIALNNPLLLPFGGNVTVRFDWERPNSGRFCHMQTAAHCAGESHYDRDVMWCAHPIYGLWCSFRAVAVFRIPFIPSLARPPVPPLISEKEKHRMAALTARAQQEDWQNIQTLIEIRDSCSLAPQHRYCEDQIEYHYSRQYQDVLARLLHPEPQGITPTTEDVVTGEWVMGELEASGSSKGSKEATMETWEQVEHSESV